jgi:lipid-binding SYLF domain-containing protein
MTAISRRRLLVPVMLAAPPLLICASRAFAASDAAEIDRDATAALRLLERKDRRAAALAPKASGILIFPRVVKAGFIFGGQGGKGALRVGGRTRQYYTIAAASFGFEAGVEYFSLVIFFMNQTALHYLDRSDGWALGTDPNVVVVNQGVAASVNSTTLAKDVVAFPFDQKGLMGGISIEGSKITTYNPA